MKPYPTQRQKTQRAYRAYVDLIDTAKWIENELRGPLWTHDLTMGEFRLLELLYREGALTLSDVIRKRQVKRQNIMVVVKRLRKRGWVERVDVTLPPVPGSQKKVGRWASVVGLTKPGKRFVGNILPTHSKLVKALMRAIDGRQQETLSLICRNLRGGDPARFFVEITHEDEELGRRPDEGETVHGERRAEAIGAGKSADARSRWARAGNAEPNLSKAARGRCGEVRRGHYT